MSQMEGFDGLCLIEDEEDAGEESENKKLEQSYIPLKREPFGFLDGPPPDVSPQIRSNFSSSTVMYHYAKEEYQTAINLSLQFLSDPINVKCNKPLLCQFHDVLCRSYLELGLIDKAKEHCQFLVESCGHGDSDVWMTAAVIEFLLGNVETGFQKLERSVAMRNSNPNIWLLYATVLAHFHQHHSAKISIISYKLHACQAHKRFYGKYWENIFENEKNYCHRYQDHLYFFIICCLNNAVRLSRSTYDQHNSKTYSRFSTAWSPEVGEILREILDSVPEEFHCALDKNYNVIHFQNWDDVTWDDVDFVNSFLKNSLPDNDVE